MLIHSCSHFLILIKYLLYKRHYTKCERRCKNTKKTICVFKELYVAYKNSGNRKLRRGNYDKQVKVLLDLEGERGGLAEQR